MPLNIIAKVFLLAPGMMLCISFLNWLHPAFDSISHFRIHLLVVSAILAGVMFAASYNGLALATTVPCVACVVWHWSADLLPQAIGDTSGNASPGAYKLMQLNVRYDNTDYQSIVELIRETGADVVTLGEIDGSWETALGALSGQYPYRIICRTEQDDGVAILSRRVFAAPGACHDRRVMTVAMVDMDGVPISVASVHLFLPWPFPQAAQIESLSAAVRGMGANAIVAGDFNAAPWSAAMKRFASFGRLRIVPSIGPTWLFGQTPFWLRRLGLPLDQVLHGDAVKVRSVRKVFAPGSDHSGLLVRFDVNS